MLFFSNDFIKCSIHSKDNIPKENSEDKVSRDANPASSEGATDKIPEISSGNPQPGGETDSQSYSLDFKSGTFIKSTEVEPATPLPVDEPETPLPNDEPETPLPNDDLFLPKEESPDQVTNIFFGGFFYIF